MFKFKKGDEVHVKFSEMFSRIFGSGAQTDSSLDSKIIDCRKHPDGKAQYKLQAYTGWWDECTLELKPEPAKNSPSREEAGGPGTLLPNEQNESEGQNKAFWDFSVSGYAKCSSCERSFEALPTVAGFKANNKFCRMCGKAMEVKE